MIDLAPLATMTALTFLILAVLFISILDLWGALFEEFRFVWRCFNNKGDKHDFSRHGMDASLLKPKIEAIRSSFEGHIEAKKPLPMSHQTGHLEEARKRLETLRYFEALQPDSSVENSPEPLHHSYAENDKAVPNSRRR